MKGTMKNTREDLIYRVMSNEPLKQAFVSLYWRWQDEQEYEDINAYRNALRKVVPQITTISTRPFGVKLKCDDGNLKWFVKKVGTNSVRLVMQYCD